LVKEVRTINSQAKAQDKLIREMFVLLARNYILNMQEEIQKQQTAASSTERLVRGQPTSAENRR